MSSLRNASTPSVQRPRESPAGRPPRPQVKPVQEPRVRRSTRATPPDTHVRVIRNEPGVVRRDKPAPRGQVAPPVTGDGRIDRTDARLERRFAPWMAFLAMMFAMIVVSVFAFGLLRDVPEDAKNAEPKPMHEVLKFENVPSSTNTGILRTNDE